MAHLCLRTQPYCFQLLELNNQKNCYKEMKVIKKFFVIKRSWRIVMTFQEPLHNFIFLHCL